MIDCAKARELANSYIDSALDDAESAAYEEHISCCENCHEEYDMLMKVAVDLASTSAPCPADFAGRVHTALVNEQFEAQKNKEKKRTVFHYYKAASVVAATLVIAVVGKYGIYDTYKNVAEDNSRMAMELQEDTCIDAENKFAKSKQLSGEEIGRVNGEQEKKSQKTSPIVNNDEKAATPEATQTETTADVTAENTVTPESAPAAVNDTAPIAESSPAGYEPAMLALENNVADMAYIEENAPKARTAESEATTDPDAETSDKSTVTVDSIDSASGDSSPLSATVVPELIPATVTIHNNGDASMIMFKKFLLTFLDSSEIAENDSGIIVTVTADEYESVMQRLRANEYVKSVTEGTPFGGKAVINIK